MSIRTGPCPGSWLAMGCNGSGILCAEYEALAPAVQAVVAQAAVDYLWNFSGRKYGVCPITVRPCRERCWTGSTYRGPGWYTRNLPWYGGALQPALIGGEWFNLSPCNEGCSGPCACGRVEEVDLAGPVDSIIEVKIDGVTLAESAYRLDNSRWLVRTDGGRWPECQAMGEDPDTIGSNTFEVTYGIGVPVPAGGQLAAGKLTCELAKLACGSSSCQLPQRVRDVTRQGVSISFDSMESLWTNGGTGLFLIDSWLASVNVRRRSGGRVASPDFRPARRAT